MILRRFTPVLIAFVVIAYAQYIIGGGSLMIDDWLMIAQVQFDQNFAATVKYWNTIGGGGNRPIASFLYALTPALWGTNPVPYILLNTACWISAILVFSTVVRRYLGTSVQLWFALLGIVPTIASSTIFEPMVMIIGTASILLWAISLWSLVRYGETKRSMYLVSTYVPIIIGLLIYEVSAPLLLLTMILPLLPQLAGAEWRSRTTMQELVRYSAPVIAIIAVLAVYQKLIVPTFGYATSRLSVRPLGDMARSFFRWLFSIIVDTPVMLVSSLTHYGWAILARWETWALVAALAAFVLMLRSNPLNTAGDSVTKSAREQRLFLVLIALTLVACSILSVLSGFNMRIEGIENRFLGSSWILLAVLLASVFARLQGSWTVIIPVFVVLMVYSSFLIQSHNYVANRRLQEAVIADCMNSLQSAQNQAFSPNEPKPFIVGNVPVYANENFNNEVVFAYRHDFGGQIKMRLGSSDAIDEGQVVNINKEAPLNDTTRFFLSRKADTILTGNLTGVMKRHLHGNVWWYEYDQYTRKSALMRIRDTLHFDSILTANRQGSVNIARLPVTERFRNSIKAMFGVKK